jgi:hypothetical protein
MAEEKNNDIGDLKPRPDPSTLTTQQLTRALEAQKEVIYTRFEAMDKAIVLLQEFANRQPTVGEVKASYDVQFTAIHEKFEERDRRFDLRDADNKAAVNAALVAAKEAVRAQQEANETAIAKSEAAFTKQIDQIGNIINSQAVTLDDKIADIRNRLAPLEARTVNGDGKHVTSPLSYIGTMLSVTAIIVMLVGFAFIITTRPDAPQPIYQTKPVPLTQSEQAPGR